MSTRVGDRTGVTVRMDRTALAVVIAITPVVAAVARDTPAITLRPGAHRVTAVTGRIIT